jgi:hypothetical protein
VARNFRLRRPLKGTQRRCVWVADVEGEVRRRYPGCCTIAAQAFSDCSKFTPQVRTLSANQHILKVGDAGFEPATSTM